MGGRNSRPRSNGATTSQTQSKPVTIDSLAKDLVAVLPEKLECKPKEEDKGESEEGMVNGDNGEDVVNGNDNNNGLPECATIPHNGENYYNVKRLNFWAPSWKSGLCPIAGISMDGKHYLIQRLSDNQYEEYTFVENKLVYLLTKVYGMNPVKAGDKDPGERGFGTEIPVKTFFPKKARAALEQARTDYQAKATSTTPGGRSLQGVSQNEGAPNGLLGDFPTGTFDQISNAFGDEHTIGYGGSGATFLASLGAYEFLGLIGFLFFFALFVMKGIRACRKKKQRKAAEIETETFEKEYGNNDPGKKDVDNFPKKKEKVTIVIEK